MLQHFQTGADVEVLRILFGHLFSRAALVVDLDPCFMLMQACHGEWRFTHVDTGHRSAAVRHGFGQNAAATADVEHGLAFETGACIDIVKAQWIDFMQRLELTVRIPPAGGELFKFADFGVIDVWSRLRHGTIGPGL